MGPIREMSPLLLKYQRRTSIIQLIYNEALSDAEILSLLSSYSPNIG
jgi:hypothetical protein